MHLQEMHTETDKLVKEQLGRKEVWNPLDTPQPSHSKSKATESHRKSK